MTNKSAGKKKKKNTEKNRAASGSESVDNRRSIKIEDELKQEEKKNRTAEPGVQEEVRDETEVLEEQLEEYKDKYLRLSAEFDNYRKRTVRERAGLIDYASADIFLKLLPVVDDIERAIISIDEAKDEKAVREGVHLIHNKLKEYLKQQGIREIEAMNKEFNTDEHEAISKIPAPSGKMKGKVLDVIEKGYFYRDKVLRYAKVVVGE